MPKRSAVAPRSRDDSIVVTEVDNNVMGIADCPPLFIETRWRCLGCKGYFKKAGRHNGILRTCKTCRASYFLRVVPIG